MLFIDANIYLEFYKSSQSDLKKLLPVLGELASEIFITKQIVDEVLRNRVGVAAASLNSYLVNYKPLSVKLPEHLDDVSQSRVKEWNTVCAKLYEESKRARKTLAAIIDETLARVMKGEDSASTVLNAVFSKAILPSQAEVEKANLRKSLGNPPGKKDDPLGDQLTWEQLLSSYDGSQPLWIISNDGDYSSEGSESRFLNAQLFSDLEGNAARQEPIVYVFNTLAEGIAHYSDNRPKPVANLPAEQVLREIAHAEMKERHIWVASNHFNDPNRCYLCGSNQGLDGPYPRPSQYGGWTYQWFCRACGGVNDYGEPYEE